MKNQMNIQLPAVRSKSTYAVKKVVNPLIELPPEYQLVEKAGQGSFGEIYKIYNTHTFTLHASKVEFRDQRQTNQQPLLSKEFKVYEKLKGIPQVPQPTQFIQRSDYNIMIMPYYGLGTLEEQRKKRPDGKFTKHCIMKIAYSLITAIEAVHEQQFIHRDIKPENFLVGSHGDQHTIYLIDYGLAKQYKENGQHIPQAENKGMVGTARYTSINSHNGSEQSRRDDLEAICYVLLYLYLGQLPWQNFSCQTRQEKFQKILEQKQKFSQNTLHFDQEIPCELREIYEYTRRLRFDQDPDYAHIKEVLKKGFGSERQHCYDWCPNDCLMRPYEDQVDQISEFGNDSLCKRLKPCAQTEGISSTQFAHYMKQQKPIEQIDEEDENSIAEFPKIQAIHKFAKHQQQV